MLGRLTQLAGLLDEKELRNILKYVENTKATFRWNGYAQNWFEYLKGSVYEPTTTENTDAQIANYVQTLIDRSVSYFVGRGVDFVFSDSEIAAEYQDLFMDNWERNGGSRLFHDMAISGAVTGDVYVKVTWVPYGENSWEKLVENKSGYVSYTLLDSEQVFPIFKAGSIEPVAYIVEYSVGESYEYEIHKKGYVIRIDKKGNVLREWETGVDSFLIIHIPNLSIPKQFYGLSEVTRLIELNRTLNDAQLDLADIVNYHASPLLVIYGAKGKQIHRSPDRVWSGLPKDAKVEAIGTLGDIKGASDHVVDLKQALAEISGIPKIAWGEVPPISNTSGAALNVLYMPVEALRYRKIGTYSLGLRQLVRLTFQILALKGEISPKSYKLEISFNPIIKRQRSEIIDEIRERRKQMLISIKRALEMLGEDTEEYNNIINEISVLTAKYPELISVLFPNLPKAEKAVINSMILKHGDVVTEEAADADLSETTSSAKSGDRKVLPEYTGD